MAEQLYLALQCRAVVRRVRARKIAWLSEVIGDLDDEQRPALGSAAALLDRLSR